MSGPPVLLTWLATRNDPYERVKSGGPFRETPKGPVPHPHIWAHGDPTDHAAIYDWLRTLLPRLPRQFPSRELGIHFSPRTAAIHSLALWCPAPDPHPRQHTRGDGGLRGPVSASEVPASGLRGPRGESRISM
jgi:hypothetical protein